MTAKEALKELVEDMSEGEAAHAYDLLRFEQAREMDQERRLTPEERAAIDRGLADLRAGRFIDHEEIEREFGSGA
ncbi:MAG: hypothetical protein WED87_02865 [Dehalococcoidia bacterium]